MKNKTAESITEEDYKVYRKLQKHFNSMPVKFPRSFSGKDIQLLKFMFTINDARLAFGMDYNLRTPDDIAQRLNRSDIDNVAQELQNLSLKGSILRKAENNTYALMPFVVGMYELQLGRADKSFFKNTFSYFSERFAFEYLTTKIPQSRVIPLNYKIENPHKIASYDELKNVIENAGENIVLVNCICRTAKDNLGEPCRHGDRRDLCLTFFDYADMALSQNIGKKISKQDALKLVEENLKAGLVIQCANDQKPNFFCSCCDDCCGLLQMFKAVPNPADHVASNYTALIDTETCVGCTLCVKRCPMNAISVENEKAILKKNRCIGCGVCTVICPKDCISLKSRKCEAVPPETVEDYFKYIETSRHNIRKKFKLAVLFILQTVKQKLFKK